MFEVGFWELALVGVVALVVFGPERLPRVARETALWVRKARTMMASVKEEINHELDLQDLKQSLLEQKKLPNTATDNLNQNILRRRQATEILAEQFEPGEAAPEKEPHD
ncbi:twin-arginine translocase subunit TatB [Candidatus Methylospira mobilis]|uniref:Sec-independent protein translocase protein TatB n=1 Tax=Candidatus Methylospira mobilis TaxID=1808979 RepID=A0A5Q0BP65_9GAMM|nr:Sec-independent protein translocase protein TatB [Candidatus Methylospira mobilis]QFY43867.1 twin-arginine translocase subunit TatB [Candidatus Methylospira mobilis]WNV04866.1 Sec-independent protein translocase protein TatB [Candidatus Methylospira mobilis]